MKNQAASPKNHKAVNLQEKMPKLLTVFIQLTMVLIVLLGTAIWLFNPADFVALGTISTIASFLLISLYFLHRGWVRVASHLLIGGIWLVMLVGVIINDGLRNPAYGGLLLVVFAAGLLFGSRAGVFTALASSVATLCLAIGEKLGWLPFIRVGDESFVPIVLTHLLYLMVSAVLLHLILQEVTNSLHEAQRTAAALAESETRIRALVEGYFEGIAISIDGKIVEANEAMATLLKYDGKQDLIGLTVQELHTADSVAAAENAMKNRLETAYEVEMYRHDGTIFPAEVMGRNALYDGQAAQIVAVRDLTKQRETEQQLRQAQKLESLGLMAGAIAHDFNNLLVAIIGQNSVAQANIVNDIKAKVHLEKSMTVAKQAENLTKQLLAYSGQGHFSLQPLRLNRLIEENVALLDLIAKKTVSLELLLDEQLPLISGDEAQIQQVLFNLILNASEASCRESINICIQTAVITLNKPSKQYGELISQTLSAGDYVALTVKDDGAGIPPENLNRIFEPFFSTKGSTGRGLGLAAILGIVRRHRGGISVQSTVGEGTSFTFLFPFQKLSN